MTTVTQKQNEYLKALRDGPKTSREIKLEIGAAVTTIGKMMQKLRHMGLVKAVRRLNSRGNTYHYSLITPYDQIVEDGLTITKVKTGIPVTEEEIIYAAKLRNAGMTGQELKRQYKKVYPDRATNGIENIIDKARRKGLCL